MSRINADKWSVARDDHQGDEADQQNKLKAFEVMN